VFFFCIFSFIKLANQVESPLLQGVTFGSLQASQVFAFVPDVSKARGAASAIVTLLDSVPEIDADSTSGKDPAEGTVTGRVRLEDVHFRYPTRPEVPVLRGMSMKVEPGMYVAIAGASGSGKSTMYVHFHLRTSAVD
jgi:ATP-binding cassette subfamily B (MDR/TAP) protein 1